MAWAWWGDHEHEREDRDVIWNDDPHDIEAAQLR